jgi:NADH-quinone oxidoreductase subunit A
MIGLTQALLVFLGIGVFFVFIHLMMGKLIRPAKPDAEKLTIYECGEPTIGSAWIQFDLRYYVVALLFVIFDVEVVFFFPWAVVFGKANTLAQTGPGAVGEARRGELTGQLVAPELRRIQERKVPDQVIDPRSAHTLARLAFWDILVFFGVLLVGFAYLWKRGDLDWVRSTAAEAASMTASAAVVHRAEKPELSAAEQQSRSHAGALVGRS